MRPSGYSGKQGAREVTVLREPEGRSVLEGLTDLGWSRETKPYLSIRVTAPPSAVATVVSQCLETSSQGMTPGVLADPGYGMVQLFWWAGPVSEWIEDALVLETLLRARRIAREAGGHAVVEHCPVSLKKQIDVWDGQPEAVEIMRRLKRKFDPLGIMNPGRFVGGI